MSIEDAAIPPSGVSADERAALAAAAAIDIRNGFADYNDRFRAVTRRAKRRFEARDFVAAQMDNVERIDLYDICVRATTTRLRQLLRERALDRALWGEIRRSFAELIAPLLDQELNKTFYNTLTRRFFGTSGVDAQIEFVALDIEPTTTSLIRSRGTVTPCGGSCRESAGACSATTPSRWRMRTSACARCASQKR